MRVPCFLTLVLCIGSTLFLTACADFEPFQRAGTWRETGAAMRNVAAELVNPEDLVDGTSRPVLTGAIAESAVGSGMKAIKSTRIGIGNSTSGNSMTDNLSGAVSGGIGVGSGVQ